MTATIKLEIPGWRLRSKTKAAQRILSVLDGCHTGICVYSLTDGPIESVRIKGARYLECQHGWIACAVSSKTWQQAFEKEP